MEAGLVPSEEGVIVISFDATRLALRYCLRADRSDVNATRCRTHVDKR